jgi:hypothetical protein
VQPEPSLQTISHNVSTTTSLRVDSTNTGTFKKKVGTTQFLPGTPIVSVTFDHPMLFEMYAPVNKDGNETFSTNAMTKLYPKLDSAILMLHGQIFIWQARDDEIYMHVLHFEKDDVKKADSFFHVSFMFRWVIGRGKY